MNSKTKIQINQDCYKKMEIDNYELINFDKNNEINMDMVKNYQKRLDFDKNVKENEKIIDEHNQRLEEGLEMRRKAAIESRKEDQKTIAKNLKKRKIKAAFYVAAGIALATVGTESYENIQGKNEIISEFDEATSSFGIRNDSTAGYIINKGSKYISFESGVYNMISCAREQGMSDSEIAIGLTYRFNQSVAEEAIGKESYPSFSERTKLYKKAYHASKLKALSQESEKGIGK